MMSLARSPAMASTGRAQNGCSMLVQASPQATAMATRVTSVSSAAAVAITIGPCTAHCPPPEGMNILMMPALIKVQNGSVAALAMEVMAPDRVAISPDSAMMAVMPA